MADYAEEVDCRLYLAEASTGMGDVAAALAIVEHLMRQIGKLRDPDLALHITRSVQSLLAQMARARGDGAGRIITYHQHAIATSQSASDRLNEVWERLRLAGSYLDLGDGRQAMDEVEQVLAEARRQGWLPLHYDSLDLLLQLSFQARDTARIEALLPEFDEVAGRDGRPEAQGRAWYCHGLLGLHLRDLESALVCLEEASRAWAESGSTQQLDATRALIAQIREQLDEVPTSPSGNHSAR